MSGEGDILTLYWEKSARARGSGDAFTSAPCPPIYKPSEGRSFLLKIRICAGILHFNLLAEDSCTLDASRHVSASPLKSRDKREAQKYEYTAFML